ncbi:MAG: DUF1345 domain-containing protein [Burkholderiales bacterium]|nr:DUF1345 domain-containing protein [Burkholderiales bacterium]
MRARPRLFSALLVGVAVGLLVPPSVSVHWVGRGLIGWNVGVGFYLVMAGIMMARSSHDHMRQRAQVQDVRPWAVLIVVIVAAIVSLIAIVLELAVAKDLHGLNKSLHIGLVAVTIVSSWAFTHTMFALHYAHDFYIAKVRGQDGGLIFPGTEDPDYADFLYLSGVIGTSGQTADVSFSSRSMRRTGLVQCMLSFAFNTTVLALTINIAASLF